MQKLCRGSFRIALSLILLASSIGGTAALADQYYDAGLKSFKSNKFSEAAQYFEVSIKNAPWESNAFYYCALAYHYMKDYKKAEEKYADCIARFPGTEAGNSSMAALKALDPDYLKRKQAELAAKASAPTSKAGAGASGGSSGSGAGGAAQDKGTVEGTATRVFYRMNDRDKVVDVSINGKATRAIFDQNGETTSFSRQQLGSLGINLPKTTTEMRGQVAIGAVVRKNFPITVEDTAQPARIGGSFLDAFSVVVSETGKTIDLKRKDGAAAAAGTGVGFTRDGKILMVSVEINGRSTQMAFDPEGGGELQFTTQQAKSMGLKLDDADTVRKPNSELPQPGEPGYIPPDERKDISHQVLSVRMKCGPVERPSVTCKITETGPKKPTFGPDFFTSNGYKFDIDYKSNKIMLTRK